MPLSPLESAMMAPVKKPDLRTKPKAPQPKTPVAVSDIREIFGMPNYDAGDRIAKGNAGGSSNNLLVDGATGEPKAMLQNRQAGIADGNAMADAAIARSRMTRPANSGYGSGLGSGVAPINVLAEQNRNAQQAAFNSNYYDKNREFYANKRKQAQRDSLADPAAPSTMGNTTVALIGDRAHEAEANRDSIMREPEMDRRADAYHERLKAQRDNANQAQGLRARMAVGKPLNQEEASMFAERANAQQESMLFNRLAQVNPSAAMQAAQNKQQLQAKVMESQADRGLKQKGLDLQESDSKSDREIKLKQLSLQEAAGISDSEYKKGLLKNNDSETTAKNARAKLEQDILDKKLKQTPMDSLIEQIGPEAAMQDPRIRAAVQKEMAGRFGVGGEAGQSPTAAPTMQEAVEVTKEKTPLAAAIMGGRPDANPIELIDKLRERVRNGIEISQEDLNSLSEYMRNRAVTDPSYKPSNPKSMFSTPSRNARGLFDAVMGGATIKLEDLKKDADRVKKLTPEDVGGLTLGLLE